jgi:phage shock protein C
MAVFCTRCGARLPVGARFCSSCGSAMPTPQTAPGAPLVRPRMGRQIAGVCLALARRNGWDVTTVRVLTVVGFFVTSGLAGLGYLAAWVGIPDEMPYPPGI